MDSMDIDFILKLEKIEDRYFRKYVKPAQRFGYYHTPESLFFYNLEFYKRHKLLRHKPKFIDLGSGLSVTLVVASYFGFDSYGIELSKDLTKGARQLVHSAKSKSLIPEDSICKIVNGSYFPNDYLKIRKAGESKAAWYEQNDKFVISDAYLNHMFFFPERSKTDVYNQIGISTKDFDVWYAYTWMLQLPSVLEIFSRYAAPNAIMLSKSAGYPLHYNRLLDDLHLEMERPIADHPMDWIRKRNITPAFGRKRLTIEK